jgi:hypothetical protein
VHSIRAGRESRFELDPEPIDELRQYLEVVSKQWDHALARLKRSVMLLTVFFRSKMAMIGTGCYILAFVCALVYPQFDQRTFSGLVAVLFALPWIDYLPSGRPFILLVGSATLNAIIIYVVLAALSRVPSMIRQRRPR